MYGHAQYRQMSATVTYRQRCSFKCNCVCAQCHMRQCPGVCFVTAHWTVMDLQDVHVPSRADKPQQGASSWAQRDHQARALWWENADLINES